MTPGSGPRSEIFERLPVAMLTTDLTGRISWANRRLAEWAGVDIVPSRTTIHDLLSAPSSLIFETTVSHTLALQRSLDEVVLELRDRQGSSRHTLWTAEVGPDDEVYWVGFDISARRNLERGAEATQRRLQRLQRLSAALVHAEEPAAVARVVLDEIVDGVKADWGAIVSATGARETLGARSIGTSTLDPTRRAALVERAASGESPIFESEPGSGPTDAAQIAVMALATDRSPLAVVCLRLQREEPHDEFERQFLLAAAEMASTALGRVQLRQRLELEAELNHRLSHLLHALETAPTVSGRAQLIAETLVPVHADMATVSLAETGQLAGLRHVDPSKEHTVRWLHARLVNDGRLHERVSSDDRRDRPIIVIDSAKLAKDDFDAREAAALASLAMTTFHQLPLVARGRRIGLLSLGRAEPDDRDDEVLEGFHARLADACALALDNARLFELERDAAQQLQSALLPERLPTDPRFSLHAYYEAAHETANVGGDWYDAFWLDADRVALVVGDVVGGGIAAARTMSELRAATGAFAREGVGVAETLRRLHRFAASTEAAIASTMVYMELDLTDGTIEFGCAGHLPPVLIRQGEPSLLWEGRSPLLGLLGEREQSIGRIRGEAGTSIVLYTDGLIERPGRSIDVGLAELRSALSADETLARHPERLGRSLRSNGHDDDTCVLVVEIREIATAIDVRGSAEAKVTPPARQAQ